MSSEAISQNQIIRSQAELIRQNIAAITQAQQQERQKRSIVDRISDGITEFSGSMAFVILHAVWFGVWVLLNVKLIHVPRISEFDPFPFGLLTMIVSLEAIFLSTFVLISQNRMSKMSEQRAELDLHVNLLAEQKATKALEMLDQLTQQFNKLSRFNFEYDPEVQALKVSPQPQEVLEAIKETVEEEAQGVKEQVKEEVKEEVGKAVGEITGEVRAVRSEVKDITGETEAVRQDVRRVAEKVSAVAGDVEEIKEKTEEHEALSAN